MTTNSPSFPMVLTITATSLAAFFFGYTVGTKTTDKKRKILTEEVIDKRFNYNIEEVELESEAEDEVKNKTENDHVEEKF